MKQLTVLVLLATALAACSDREPVADATVPRVKLFTVGQSDSNRARRFSGTVVASELAPLSFAIGGTVESVDVSEGDAVRQGQLLASLDDTPVRIALESARAEFAIARANLDESRATYERVSALSETGAISRADVETSTTAFSSAQSGVRSAQAEIDRLERDLANASLVAPFDGTVGERSVEPFQEISPGQGAFVLLTTESLNVEANIPESMIGEIEYGNVVEVTFPAIDGLLVAGTVETIGSRAESGNSFPVTVRMLGDVSGARPGMSAGVTFILDSAIEGQAVYLIPISAIAIDAGISNGLSPDDSNRRAPVFVFNEATGELSLREISVGDLRGNQLEVLDGLDEGDRIVSAGVPFLRDGQVVEEWRPEQGLDNG